jgi:hypothetical protein
MKAVREESPIGSFGFSVPDDWEPIHYLNPGGLAGRIALFLVSALLGAVLGAVILAVARHGEAGAQVAMCMGSLAGAILGLVVAWKLVLPRFRMDGAAYGCEEAMVTGTVAFIQGQDPLEVLELVAGESWTSATSKRSFEHGPGISAAR